MVVGWYHSHPGFGCWLSGVDINTQQVRGLRWEAWQDGKCWARCKQQALGCKVSQLSLLQHHWRHKNTAPTLSFSRTSTWPLNATHLCRALRP